MAEPANPTMFFGGWWPHFEGASLNRYYEWLLAEARWWADIWSAEAIQHGGGLDWWAGQFPWELIDSGS